MSLLFEAINEKAMCEKEVSLSSCTQMSMLYLKTFFMIEYPFLAIAIFGPFWPFLYEAINEKAMCEKKVSLPSCTQMSMLYLKTFFIIKYPLLAISGHFCLKPSMKKPCVKRKCPDQVVPKCPSFI